MAAIFGPGGPIILPWTVRGDHFSGGTVHGVTDQYVSCVYCLQVAAHVRGVYER